MIQFDSKGKAEDTEILNSYFEFLYGEEEGYAYSPVKTSTGAWKKYFFKWPDERQELIDHVQSNTKNADVYCSPSLFRSAEATKEAWLGTRVLWAEFDYGTPDKESLGSLPDPSLRICSSTEGHEHWYWTLPLFASSIEVFERTSRRIAYGLKADLGTWNANRVLRPPTTIHHESGKRVTRIGQTGSSATLEDFDSLPEVSVSEVKVIDDVPDVMDVIARYKWPTDTFATFRERNVPKGGRSDKLVWLAYECADMGLTNAEMLSVLLNVDGRWKKFQGRDDQREQLTNIIARARLKFPFVGEEFTSDTKLPVVGSTSFVAQSLKLNWVLRNAFAEKSIGVIVSPQAVGKTQVSLNLGIDLALGRNFLHFPVEKPFKTIFFSLEMGDVSLHYFMSQMFKDKTEDELQLLERNFLVVPLGESLHIPGSKDQLRIEEVMEEYRPDGVLIDSLGRSVKGSSSDETMMGESFDFFKRNFIKRHGAFVWLIHHFRKAQVGNKKPEKLDDLRGSGVIGDNADLVLSMWSPGPGAPIQCQSLKTRMSPEIPEFAIQRNESLGFEVVDPGEPWDGSTSALAGGLKDTI